MSNAIAIVPNDQCVDGCNLDHNNDNHHRETLSERNGTECPVSSSSSSCSEDDDVLPCKETLLGLVSMDEHEEYDNNNNNNNMEPSKSTGSSPRDHHSQQDPEQENHPPQYDDHERIRTDYFMLKEALEALSNLAAMDSTEYQDRLLANGLLPTTNTTTSTTTTAIPSTITSPVLLSSSSPGAAISRLTHSICRLHSLVDNLTRENDLQTVELIQLQQRLTDNREQTYQLEQAVAKLHDKNVKLRNKWKKEKSIGRKLMEQVQQRVTTSRRQQEESFQLLASRLQHHEQIMREKSSGNLAGSNHGTKERCDSNGTFDGLQEFNDAASIGSSVSTTSLVTDDGVATIKLNREPTLTWPPVELQAPAQESIETNPSFASTNNSKTTTRSSSNNALATAMGELNNPFAAFLGPRVAHPYTLSLAPPFLLQFVRLEWPQTTTAATASNDKTNSTSCPKNSNDVEFAFLVCGYHGFDATINVKPTLGARILQVGEETINESYTTVEQVEAAIARAQRELAKNKKRSLAMIFRNDNLDKKQKDLLNAAVQENLKKYPRPPPSTVLSEACAQPFLRKRADSNSSSNPTGGNNNNNNPILGFLNFNHHSNGHGTIRRVASADEGVESRREPLSQDNIGTSASPLTPVSNHGNHRVITTPNSDGKPQRSSSASPDALQGVMGFLNFNHHAANNKRLSPSPNGSQRQATEVPALTALRMPDGISNGNNGSRKLSNASTVERKGAAAGGVMAFLNLGPVANSRCPEEKEGIRFDDEDMSSFDDSVIAKDSDFETKTINDSLENATTDEQSNDVSIDHQDSSQEPSVQTNVEKEDQKNNPIPEISEDMRNVVGEESVSTSVDEATTVTEHSLSALDELVVVEGVGNGDGIDRAGVNHNKLQASASQAAKETAEKFKSSMKSMGKKMFAFR